MKALDELTKFIFTGANINTQTEETQETALTLASCGGFQEVVSYLLECGADIELGASSPLMEAATEGHVELVKFLLEKSNVIFCNFCSLFFVFNNFHKGVLTNHSAVLPFYTQFSKGIKRGYRPLMD